MKRIIIILSVLLLSLVGFSQNLKTKMVVLHYNDTAIIMGLENIDHITTINLVKYGFNSSGHYQEHSYPQKFIDITMDKNIFTCDDLLILITKYKFKIKEDKISGNITMDVNYPDRSEEIILNNNFEIKIEDVFLSMKPIKEKEKKKKRTN